MENDRPPGFYWVSWRDTWEPMPWDGEYWYRTGDEQPVMWMDEIGEPVRRSTDAPR